MRSSSLGRRLIAEKAEDSVLVLGRNPRSQISLKLGEKRRLAFRSTSRMANRIFYRDFLGRTSIRKKGLNRVSNRAFSRIEIIAGKTGTFLDFNLAPQLVDQRILTGPVSILLTVQATPHQRSAAHLLNARITTAR